MPPKKKSGKKGKGKKSGKNSATGVPAAASSGEQLNELSKEFYLIQIRDMENRLNRYNYYSVNLNWTLSYLRYQSKCDELEVMNGTFKDQYDQMADDKKQIISYLHKTLDQRGKFSFCESNGNFLYFRR